MKNDRSVKIKLLPWYKADEIPQYYVAIADTSFNSSDYCGCCSEHSADVIYLQVKMHFLSFLFLTTSYVFRLTSAASSTQSVLRSLDRVPVLHSTLNRRGDVFSATELEYYWVNLAYMSKELE